MAKAVVVGSPQLDANKPSPPMNAPPGRAGGVLTLPDDDRDVAPLVNRLAWPGILENIFQSGLEITNTVLVARLGASAIAGIGGATTLIWLISAAFFAISVGTTVMVARFVGAGDHAGANRVVRQSVLLVVTFGLLMGVPGYFWSRAAVGALGLESSAAEMGGDYIQVVTTLSIVFVGIIVLGAALRGAGDTRTPMIVTGLINVVNVCLAYVLIFGELGLPAMGVLGSAWAATISRGVGATILLLLLLKGRSGVSIAGRDGWGLDLPLMGRLLNVGLPSMFENLLMSGAMLAYNLIVVGMGTVTYAAFRITMNAMMVSIMPGFGFAMAATTLTGQSLGASRPELANNSTYYAVKAGVIWMTAMGVAFFLFGEPIMRVFTADAEIVRLGVGALQVIALAQPFHALALVFSGSLRGAGDTRYPMAVTALSMWLVRVPAGFLLGSTLGLGLAGVYFSSVLDAAARAAFNWLRYRAGGWRKIQI